MRSNGLKFLKAYIYMPNRFLCKSLIINKLDRKQRFLAILLFSVTVLISITYENSDFINLHKSY